MRWLILLLMVLMLAIVTTLLTAWGCVLWSPEANRDMHGLQVIDPLVRPHKVYGTYDRAMTVMSEGFGWRQDNIMAFTDAYAGGPHNQTRRTLFRAGWPRLAWQGERWHVYGEPGPERGLIDAPALLLDEDQTRQLPIRPIWSGLLFNSLLIAAIPVLIVLAFPARAMLRRRRGRCPACGYILKGLEASKTAQDARKCPECGSPR